MDKKMGAMFGLDARIALTIFAFLSVITGVVLYKIIRHTTAVAIISDMQEIGKAWEQYLLDVGEDLPGSDITGVPESVFHRRTDFLVLSTKQNWKGPYLNYEIISPAGSYVTAVYPRTKEGVHLISIKDGIWGGSTRWDANGNTCTLDGKDCYVWVVFAKIKGGLEVDIDKIIDGGDGADVGKFRWIVFNDAYDMRVYFKYAPYGMPSEKI